MPKCRRKVESDNFSWLRRFELLDFVIIGILKIKINRVISQYNQTNQKAGVGHISLVFFMVQAKLATDDVYCGN